MNKQQLNELSIFALRELARRTGVSSPTSKKKHQLIEEIVNISEGRQEPNFPSTKQGRPPKGFIADFGDILTAKENTNSKNLTFKQDCIITDEQPHSIYGYIELLSSNIAFIWVKGEQGFEKFFITSDLLASQNLKTGDFINAEVFQKEGQMVINKIFSINGKGMLVDRLDFANIPAKLSSKAIEFADSQFNELELEFGENIFIYGANNKHNTMYVVELLNSMEASTKIYVNLSLIEKNRLYLNDLKSVQQFTANLTDELEYSRKMIHLATKHAARIAEQGEDAVIVIDDMLSLISIDHNDLEITKSLVSLTKNTDKGSVTIIAIMPTNREINILEKLADKKFLLTKNSIEQI